MNTVSKIPLAKCLNSFLEITIYIIYIFITKNKFSMKNKNKP